MTHPLTDEMIEQNFTPEYGYVESDSILGVSEVNYGFNSNDLRHAYNMGADWKLGQVIDWIEATLTAGDVIAEDLKKAMRPQENN